MPMEPLSAAAAGAFAWECVKQLASAVMKRRGEAAAARRKMLQDDLKDAASLVGSCVQDVEEYFLAPPGDAVRTTHSRSVRKAMGKLGSVINQINVGFLQAGLTERVESSLLIGFRRSSTMHLDDKDLPQLSVDDPKVAEVFRRAHFLSSALTRLRYSVA